MQKNNIISLAIIALFGFLAIGCRNNTNKPNLKNIQIQKVTIQRYEQDLFRIPIDSLQESLRRLANKYPLFIGKEYENPASLLQMRQYLNDPQIIEAYVQACKTFPSVTQIEDGLTEAFRYILYYFPSWHPPKQVYSYISGYDLAEGIFINDTVLIIPIDNYLGSDFSGYRAIGIPKYITERMTPEYLIADVVKTIAQQFLTPFPTDGNLIEQMIAFGKLFYFAQNVLPETEPYFLIGYTPEKYKWCQDNEKKIWSFLVGQNLLFNKDKSTIMKFIQESPTTQGFPKGSPGRIGQYMGWRIVESYAKKHPEEHLAEIIQKRDLVQIFNQSGYKPPQ